MALEGHQHPVLRLLQVPDVYPPVVAPGGQQLVARAEGQALDRPGRPGQRRQRNSARQIPQAHEVILPASGEYHAISADRHALDPFALATESGQLRPGRHVPHANAAAPVAGGQARSVRAERQAAHRIAVAHQPLLKLQTPDRIRGDRHQDRRRLRRGEGGRLGRRGEGRRLSRRGDLGGLIALPVRHDPVFRIAAEHQRPHQEIDQAAGGRRHDQHDDQQPDIQAALFGLAAPVFNLTLDNPHDLASGYPAPINDLRGKRPGRCARRAVRATLARRRGRDCGRARYRPP